MDDEVLVGKLDGLANPHEQREPLGHGKTLLFTEAMDGNSIHILHHQIEIAVAGNAAIQQAGNEGMLQSGKNLPFLTKSLPEEIGGKGQVNQFDGDLLLELPIGAMRQINGAHAATTQQTIQQERTDLLHLGCGLSASFRLQPAGCRQTFFRFAGLEQRIYLGGKGPVPVASGLNQFRPRSFRSREGLVEDGLNLQKAFRGLVHGSDNPVVVLLPYHQTAGTGAKLHHHFTASPTLPKGGRRSRRLSMNGRSRSTKA